VHALRINLSFPFTDFKINFGLHKCYFVSVIGGILYLLDTSRDFCFSAISTLAIAFCDRTIAERGTRWDVVRQINIVC
jgi:hypothetical protein